MHAWALSYRQCRCPCCQALKKDSIAALASPEQSHASTPRHVYQMIDGNPEGLARWLSILLLKQPAKNIAWLSAKVSGSKPCYFFCKRWVVRQSRSAALAWNPCLQRLVQTSFLPFPSYLSCACLYLSLVFLVVKTRVYKGVSPVVSVCRFPSATIMTAASALRKDGPWASRTWNKYRN